MSSFSIHRMNPAFSPSADTPSVTCVICRTATAWTSDSALNSRSTTDPIVSIGITAMISVMPFNFFYGSARHCIVTADTSMPSTSLERENKRASRDSRFAIWSAPVLKTCVNEKTIARYGVARCRNQHALSQRWRLAGRRSRNR